MAKHYTQTKKWKELRQEVITDAGGKCRLCNGTEKLTAHHRVYDEESEEGCCDKSDLVAICNRCHYWFHMSQQAKKLGGENKVAKWKGKKQREQEIEAAQTFPAGLEHRLEFLINKHIDFEKMTTREAKAGIDSLKTAILLGAA